MSETLLAGWEVLVAQRGHRQTLHQAVSSTILPLLNPHFSTDRLNLNAYELLARQKILSHEPLSIISIMDLDGSVFPYPFVPCFSPRTIQQDYRAAYRFIHEVTSASSIAEIITGRFSVSDLSPRPLPQALWNVLTSHFPLIRPHHEAQIAHLGDFKSGDQWINKLRIITGKDSQELIKQLPSHAHLIYYFGDADIDRRISRQIRDTTSIPTKFIRMGSASHKL